MHTHLVLSDSRLTTQHSDSVSHTKTSLIGASIQIPITDGRLNLGTWQGESPCFSAIWKCMLMKEYTGIYLTEFRYRQHTRKVVATIL